MQSFLKLLNISKQLTSLACSRVNSTQQSNLLHVCKRKTFLKSHIHTSSQCYNLMEFFDDEKNWGENEVKSGRAWTRDELRIKSNSDLHKLWFVLLKERNMLMTMEHECNDKMELFPSPERIDKIKLSMENLEEVVRERNRAYHLLETGETGERTGELQTNVLGINFFYRPFEHLIPKFMNTKWRERNTFNKNETGGQGSRKFLLLYREKLWNEKRKQKNRDRNEVMNLLRRFPNIDKKMLAEKFPSVDIKKLLDKDRCRGHYVPSNS